MKSSNIDEQIRKALADEDAEFFDQFSKEPSLIGKAIESFRTQDRFANTVVILFSFVFLGLLVYSLWNFFAADEVKSLMSWALLFGFSLGGISMLKIWAWLEIQKNNVTREVKRLELQVARLTQRLGESS